MKKINTQTKAAPSRSTSGRSSASHTVGSRGGYHASASLQDDYISDNGRSVVTERTAYNRNAARPGNVAGRNNGQQRVAINSNMIDDMMEEDDYDYEELE